MKKMVDQGALSLNSDELAIVLMSELDLYNVKNERLISEYSTLKDGVHSQTIICEFATWGCFWVVLLKDDMPCDLKYFGDLTALDYDLYVVRSVNSVLKYYIESNHAELNDFVDIVNMYFEQDIRQGCFSEKFMKKI